MTPHRQNLPASPEATAAPANAISLIKARNEPCELATQDSSSPDSHASIPDDSANARAPLANADSTPSNLNSPADAPTAGHTFSEAEWREADERAGVCKAFIELTGAPQHLTMNAAAALLGKSPSFFSGTESMLAKFQRDGVAGLLPRRRECGAKASFEVPAWFIPAARFFWLLINANCHGGSVPEAVRRVISLPNLPCGWKKNDVARFLRALDVTEPPVCPVELRERILARERAGQPLIPARLAQQIPISRAAVGQFRNGTEAGLTHLNAPGTMMWNRGPGSAEREFTRAGDVVEADDGTINFPVCIPWTMGGCPTSDKFGVKIGRFQFLRPIDAGSRFRPGYVYVARPRGSYRREDVLALMRMVARHPKFGIPRAWRFERGTWESHMVKDAVTLLGSQLQTVYSPRQKPFVEGGFNQDWKKLSVHFPGADVGRFMGETEEANTLLTKCKAGTEDPRKHFPMLATALAAFDEITREQNSTPVNSAQYGRWIPEERLTQHLAERPLPRLDPNSEWIFSPFVREWTVRGMLVGGKVPLFEELSVPFDFSAPWLSQFHGHRVRLHFDPSEPRCAAKVVLLENCGTRRAGDVLGDALMINEVAGYARLVMGWGDDPTSLGRKLKQQAASAMRREVRAVLPRNGPSTGESEMRDGLGNKAVVTHDGEKSHGDTETRSETTSPSVPPCLRGQPEAPTADELARMRDDVARFERDNAHLFT